MIKRGFILFTIFFFCLCNVIQAQNPSPNSCKIEGKIIRILPILKKDTESLCSKYPCRAKVKIIQSYSCGSSVTQILNAGDTVEMKFAYTLHTTAKILPKMKVKYPGLKKGSLFTANVEQRIKIGSGNEFVIYGYKRK